MAKSTTTDSHFPNTRGKEEDGPLRQHFRLAVGESINGQNLEVNEKLPVNNKSTIAGQRKNY